MVLDGVDLRIALDTPLPPAQLLAALPTHIDKEYSVSDLYDLPVTTFTPTAEDIASVHAWFSRYDALAVEGDIEGMADQAVFPLNVVSDTPGGDGAATQWDREQFVAAMSRVMGGGSSEVKLESTRTPHFLSGSLVMVVTDAIMTAPGAPSQPTRYADLLLKRDGGWAFQTMVQSGWGTDL